MDANVLIYNNKKLSEALFFGQGVYVVQAPANTKWSVLSAVYSCLVACIVLFNCFALTIRRGDIYVVE